MMGDGANATETSGIPEYDEDLDEAFEGPAVLREYEDEYDGEYYDNEYEEDSQALVEATMEGANPSRSSLLNDHHIVSDHTHSARARPLDPRTTSD